MLRGHGGLLLEADHHGAGSVLGRFVAQHAQSEVAAIAVDLADAPHQVVQVRLGAVEHRVVGQFLRPPFCQHCR
ncbi:hypothetical protein D3C81_2024150 [compost metagenome]